MSGLTRSEELDRKLRLLGASFWDAVGRVWSHPEVAQLCPHVLFKMHCEVRTSVPVMEAALARLKELDGDPVAPGMIAYLEELIPGEKGHDEWLLDGLEAVGVSRQEALARTPPHTVAALVGAQYYWIHHFHPVALLGYIKMVEIDPATAEGLDGLIARTGLPRGAFKYHFGHAKLEIRPRCLTLNPRVAVAAARGIRDVSGGDPARSACGDPVSGRSPEGGDAVGGTMP